MQVTLESIAQTIDKNARWADFAPLNFDERAIAYCITFTFAFYLVGALYLIAPIIGWSLLIMSCVRWSTSRSSVKQNSAWLIKLWIVGVIILEMTLILGHLDFSLGFGKIVKSTIGWIKGWALLSVFIVLGYSLSLRYQVICRAACIVGLCALLVTPILFAAYLGNLPGHLYTSPLQVFGGAGPEFFTVILYEIDPFNGSPRWRFFAPGAPAVGLVANIYFIASWFEKNLKWKLIGLLGNAIMIVLAVSRMGMLVMLIAPLAVWGLSRLTRPWIMIIAAILLMAIVVFFEPISHTLVALLDDIKNTRADSTRVREALGNIALYRWQSEAYWFGHGVVETGSHLVEFMPIGSHHNWYGLLFVKGITGLLSFLIPFALTCAVLLVKAQYQVSSRLALGMCLILTCFSMSENIEALAYMTWPAWLLIGIGLRSAIEDIDTNPNNLMGQLRLISNN